MRVSQSATNRCFSTSSPLRLHIQRGEKTARDIACRSQNHFILQSIASQLLNCLHSFVRSHYLKPRPYISAKRMMAVMIHFFFINNLFFRFLLITYLIISFYNWKIVILRIHEQTAREEIRFQMVLYIKYNIKFLYFWNFNHIE